MWKRILLAVVLVFVAWSLADFVIHGVILQSAYEQTAAMWRPMEQMKMGLMRAVVFLAATCFCLMYGLFVSPRNLKSGLAFGALFGFGAGVSMGYGTYSVMPIPYALAFTWFAGTLFEGVLAGAVAGLVMRTPKAAA